MKKRFSAALFARLTAVLMTMLFLSAASGTVTYAARGDNFNQNGQAGIRNDGADNNAGNNAGVNGNNGGGFTHRTAGSIDYEYDYGVSLISEPEPERLYGSPYYNAVMYIIFTVAAALVIVGGCTTALVLHRRSLKKKLLPPPDKIADIVTTFSEPTENPEE